MVGRRAAVEHDVGAADAVDIILTGLRGCLQPRGDIPGLPA